MNSFLLQNRNKTAARKRTLSSLARSVGCSFSNAAASGIAVRITPQQRHQQLAFEVHFGGQFPPTTRVNLKLKTIRLLRPVLDRVPSSSPRLKKFRRRLELGELNRTNLVQYRVELAREMGATIGKNCRFFSLHIFSEPRLVDIGENTIMSGNVVLLTHDGAIHSSAYIELPDINGYYGRISIGRNCFIGFGSIIMPNVRIGDNCIVCPGSVVIESFPENSVIRGNPARIIASRSNWVREKEKSPNTIIDPVYRFPIVIPEDVLMERVGDLPIDPPRQTLPEETAS